MKKIFELENNICKTLSVHTQNSQRIPATRCLKDHRKYVTDAQRMLSLIRCKGSQSPTALRRHFIATRMAMEGEGVSKDTEQLQMSWLGGGNGKSYEHVDKSVFTSHNSGCMNQ